MCKIKLNSASSQCVPGVPNVEDRDEGDFLTVYSTIKLVAVHQCVPGTGFEFS